GGGRAAGDRALDLLGKNFVAAGLDHVAGAADEMQPAMRIEASEIAGLMKTRLRVLVEPRRVDVAAQHVARAQEDFADFDGRRARAVVAAHLDLDATRRP